MKLITKLTLLIGAMTTILVLIASIAIIGITYLQAENQIKNELANDTTHLIAHILTVRGDRIDTVEQDGGTRLAETLRENNLSLIIADKTGTPVAIYGIYRNLTNDERTLFVSESVVRDVLENKQALYRDVTAAEHGTYDTYTAPLLRDGEVMGYVQVSRYNTLTPILSAAIFKSLFIIIPMLIFVTVVSSRYATTLLLDPLEKLTQHLSTLEGETVPKSLKLSHGLPQEIETIISAFNSLVIKLTTKAREEREILENISHEIKTPLTRISSTLQTMLPSLSTDGKKRLRTLIDETLQLGRVVETLLEVSQKSYHSIPGESYSLRTLVQEVVTELAARSTTQVLIADHVVITTPYHPTRILIRNIIANAVTHSRPHSPIVISGDNMQLHVRNTVKHSTPHYSARRGEKSTESTGYGLGTSIISFLAKKLHLTISQSRPTHTTLAITLSFPPTP